MKQLTYYISDEFISKVVAKISDRTYLIAILLLGILIRGKQYLANRSFWLDEAFLALNFKSRGYMQLLEPLDYHQVAPVGFLWVEKFMGNLFGVNEMSLRFIPLLSSIIAIYLLYDLVRVLLNKRLALYIAFAFILLQNLTYFSSELKQYMTDLFITQLLFWYFFRFVYLKYKALHVIILGGIGAVCVWFSNITPIILLSIGLPALIDLYKGRSYNKLLSISISYILWMISFYVYYIYFIKDHPHRAGMLSYWADSFMPHHFFNAIGWFFDRLFFVFKETISHYEMAIPAMLFFFIGLGSLFQRNAKKHLYILSLPILIHLILSFFNMYPFNNRLVLYLVPFFLIIEIVGIDYIASKTKKKYGVTALLLFILFALSLLRTFYVLKHPLIKEDIKPVLQYVSSHKEKNDIVYVYYGAHAAFKFYKDNYFSEEDHCIVGVASSDHYDKFIKEFSGLKNRVWIVFSHMNPPDGIEYLNSEIPNYQQLDYFEAEGAKVYLIDKI